MFRDIRPEHRLLVIRLQHFIQFRDVVQINLPQSFLRDQILRLSATQLKRFIRADMKKRPFENRSHRCNHFPQQVVTSRLRRRQHRSVRHFGKLAVNVVPQHIVEMPVRFQFRHNRHVIFLCVAHQLANLIRRQRIGRRKNPVPRHREHILHVQRVHIQLESRQHAYLVLHELQRWYRAATDINAHSAPFHRRPIANRNRGTFQLACASIPRAQLFSALRVSCASPLTLARTPSQSHVEEARSAFGRAIVLTFARTLRFACHSEGGRPICERCRGICFCCLCSFFCAVRSPAIVLTFAGAHRFACHSERSRRSSSGLRGICFCCFVCPAPRRAVVPRRLHTFVLCSDHTRAQRNVDEARPAFAGAIVFVCHSEAGRAICERCRGTCFFSPSGTSLLIIC